MVPSLPSNVLGVRVAPEAATNKMPKATAAPTTVAHNGQYRRPLPPEAFLARRIVPAPPLLSTGRSTMLLAHLAIEG
jgi:hypothetical protein